MALRDVCSVCSAVVKPRNTHVSMITRYSPLLPPHIHSSPVRRSLGDFTGRFLSGYGPWARGPPKPLSILAYAIIRCGMAVAILFCHLVTPTLWLLDEYLSQDYWPWTVILLLGCTQVSEGAGGDRGGKTAATETDISLRYRTGRSGGQCTRV